MIQQEESIRVAREIMDKFNKWADERIGDWSEAIPSLSQSSNDRRCGQVEALQSAKINLMRIIREVTGIEK